MLSNHLLQCRKVWDAKWQSKQMTDTLRMSADKSAVCLPVIHSKLWEASSLQIGAVSSSQTTPADGEADESIGVKESW